MVRRRAAPTRARPSRARCARGTTETRAAAGSGGGAPATRRHSRRLPSTARARSSATMSVRRDGHRSIAATVAAAMSAMWTSETKSEPSPGIRSLPAAARANQSSSNRCPARRRARRAGSASRAPKHSPPPPSRAPPRTRAPASPRRPDEDRVLVGPRVARRAWTIAMLCWSKRRPRASRTPRARSACPRGGRGRSPRSRRARSARAATSRD